MKSIMKRLLAVIAIVAVAIGIVPSDNQLKTEEGSLVKSELVEPAPSSEEDVVEVKKVEPTETHEEIIARLVEDVNNGKAGNGEDRKAYLGEYYSEVQSIINKKYEAIEKAKPKVVTKQGSNQQSNQVVTEAVTGSKAEYQAYARDLVINQYGWSESDFNALVNLWNRESGWNPNSHNSSSGAHGIAQALPASKMASEGSDYYTSGYTQIRWGLKYIQGRYGSPSNAWQHFLSKGWY